MKLNAPKAPGLPGRFSHVDEGAGDPVVLLLGNPAWGFLYRKFMGPLRAAGRCAISRIAARLGRLWWHILHEPLVHFLVAGAFLFTAGHYYQAENSTYRIVLTNRHIAQLGNDYALQFGQQPDPNTLNALIRRDIHDEILYRQGLALKLDEDDLVVRRRIAQKMEFLLQDLHPPAEPSDAQLQAYYRVHLDKFVIPPRVTFSHIYFSADRNDAEARARAVLATLSDRLTRAPDKGDPFPDLYDFSAYEPEQVSRLFGRTPFSTAVFSIPPSRWAGPFRSGYGWHLIYVDARQGASHQPFPAVRDQVRTGYLQDAQDRANKQAFDALASRFTVVREDGRRVP